MRILSRAAQFMTLWCDSAEGWRPPLSIAPLGLGALLLAAPIAVPLAGAVPLPPYHLAGGAGHEPLQLAGWSGRGRDHDDDHDDDHDGWDDDDDRDRRRSHWRHGKSWRHGPWGHGHWNGQPGWSGVPHFAARPLPGWVIEHRLRRQHVHPIGRMSLRHGLYLVPVLDRYGRRVVIVVDPTTAAILGRARHW